MAPSIVVSTMHVQSNMNNPTYEHTDAHTEFTAAEVGSPQKC